MPTQNVAPEELAAFYVAYGVPQQRFIDTLKSAAVEDKVKAAREFATRAKIPGTPALVVNGRYLITARDYTDMLRVADYLIAREHAAPPRAEPHNRHHARPVASCAPRPLRPPLPPHAGDPIR